jgi:hypothetical protein
MSARLDDGFKTLVTFANFPSVKFWTKTVKPPGMSGGGANETTTMHNTTWRTNAPKKLKTMTDSTQTAAYDPQVYQDIPSMINTNQLITITFSDGSQVKFWGWLDEFEPNEIKEGEQPTADVKIIPSNQNSSGVETAPVYVAA